MRTVWFLLQKEFRQIFRDKTMLRMLILVPVVQLLVLANAATFEVKQGMVWLVDLDQSQVSRGLIQRVVASGRFEVSGTSFTMAPADRALLDREAAVIISIPQNFERDLIRGGVAEVQLVLDAEDGAAAAVMQNYLNQIMLRYSAELSREAPLLASAGQPEWLAAPVLEVRHRGWFNPELKYTDYMVPGILVVLVTIIAMAITSMNIVREKEIGTLEQLNVTPVTRGQFVASKLLPFWLIALFDLSLGLVVARLVFGIPMAGSLPVVFLGAVVYLFVALGIGLWISTVVQTQQQAIFISFTINMVYLLMSGLFTPVSSMPKWAQLAAELSPVKHFIAIMRAVLVKGAALPEVMTPLLVLAVYGTVVFTLAVRQYRKTTA